jgi:hypothetical protein
METIEKVVEYNDLKYNMVSEVVNMIVPVAYNDPFNNTINGSSNRLSRGYWKKRLDDTNRLTLDLAQELGIDKDQLTNVIMETLKNKNDDNDQLTNEPLPMKQEKMCVLLNNHNNKYVDPKPHLLLSQMDNKLIKDITGFPSLSAVL